jgi:hypothetical protein
MGGLLPLKPNEIPLPGSPISYRSRIPGHPSNSSRTKEERRKMGATKRTLSRECRKLCVQALRAESPPWNRGHLIQARVWQLAGDPESPKGRRGSRWWPTISAGLLNSEPGPPDTAPFPNRRPLSTVVHGTTEATAGREKRSECTGNRGQSAVEHRHLDEEACRANSGIE